jgi:hypothetical protein
MNRPRGTQWFFIACLLIAGGLLLAALLGGPLPLA